MQNRIVCAANRCGSIIVLGVRHYDTIMTRTFEQLNLAKFSWYKAEQGFIDKDGKFLTREQAWKIASDAGQINYRVGGDTANGGALYSENLY